MCLSTVDAQGWPEGRMVLLKGFDERGFVFYTSIKSAKGKSLAKHRRAALTFYWEPLHRQVRIQGSTRLVSDEEADAYWRTRPRLSQIGAWVSHQSEPLPSNVLLIKEAMKLGLKFMGREVPRPPHWTGYRVKPRAIEFWQGRPNRLHDRFLYTRTAKTWRIQRLYP